MKKKVVTKTSSGKYKKLFEPLTVGKLTIKNRISMAPLGMIAMADPCGGFTENAQEYYVERAKGGPAHALRRIQPSDVYEIMRSDERKNSCV
jgi:2-enoate reductase